MSVVHELVSLKNIEKSLKNIEKNTINKKSFLLLIHAGWCHHCRMLMPAWIEAVDALKKGKTDIHIISMTDDVKSYIEDNKSDSNLYDVIKYVKGFPTLLGVKHKKENNNIIELYDGDRSKKSLKKFGESLV